MLRKKLRKTAWARKTVMSVLHYINKKNENEKTSFLRVCPPVYVITVTLIWILDEKSGPQL